MSEEAAAELMDRIDACYHGDSAALLGEQTEAWYDFLRAHVGNAPGALIEIPMSFGMIWMQWDFVPAVEEDSLTVECKGILIGRPDVPEAADNPPEELAAYPRFRMVHG